MENMFMCSRPHQQTHKRPTWTHELKEVWAIRASQSYLGFQLVESVGDLSRNSTSMQLDVFNGVFIGFNLKPEAD